MIKRTLYFGNSAYLSTRNEQLVLNFPNAKGMDEVTGQNTVPIEDIGVVILDHQQITVSQALIAKLLDNNVALITCDSTHHPTGLMLNLCGHQLQSAKFRAQIETSEPLKKQLWQQTVKAKILNQAAHLRLRKKNYSNLSAWINDVKSGDTDNYEARAAVYYWKTLFDQVPNFTREREGIPPNNLLNYAYAILRAQVARALVGSGLLPTLGIFHRNQYNAYCLADDIMEPYRPFADKVVFDLVQNGEDFTDLNPSVKKELLSVQFQDVYIENERSPLQVAIQRTTASLSKCFEGKSRKILYPEMPINN